MTKVEVRTHNPVAVAAALILTLAGSITFILTPVLIGTLRKIAGAIGMTESQIGLIGSADPTGMFIGAIIAYIAIARFNRRHVVVAALSILNLCNLLCIFITDFEVLFAVRLLAGVCGGLTMAVGFALIGSTIKPGWYFALFTVVQTLTGSALSAILAVFERSPMLGHVYMAAIAGSLIGLVAAQFIDVRVPAEVQEIDDAQARAPVLMTPLNFFANAFYALAFLMYWANIQGVGEFAGVSARVVEATVPIGLIGGAIGGLVSGFLDARCSRVVCCTVYVLAMVLCVTVNFWEPTAILFLTSAFVLQFALGSQAFVFGAISEADASGRLPVVLLFAVKAGFSVGPAIASQVLLFGGFPYLLYATNAALLISMVLYVVLLLWTARLGKAGPKPDAATQEPASGNCHRPEHAVQTPGFQSVFRRF